MNVIDKVNQDNPFLIKLLKNSFNQNKVAHAFIFSASEGVKIENEPSLLINSIIENKVTEKDHSTYSDLEIIDGSKKLIKKEFVINAINKMKQTSLDQRGYRILLIKNIENGNKQSLNSLLKFLEEPKNKTYIIMTTNKLNNVLSTIKSRSQIIYLKKPNKKRMEDEIADVPIPYNKIIAWITNSLQEAKDLANSKNDILLIKEVIELFIKNAQDKNNFIISLNKILNKSNYKIIIPTLRILINDVWKHQENENTITNFYESFKKYKNINYQYILKTLSSFIIIIKNNGNFELAKTKLLMEIEDNYE